MGAVITTPLAVASADKFPVVPIANGIVPDEALAITVNLQFNATTQAILVDLSESARKFNVIPIQGAFIDTSGSAIDLRIDNSVTGQSILAKAGLQGYYNLLCPMPAKLIAVLASAPTGQLNITMILYNTVIESEVWGLTSGAAGPVGPQGPPGATGPTGPQGPAGTISPATATTLGGVKIGSNVNVLADGTISVAAPYVLPVATATVLGGVKAGTGVTAAADGTISVAVLAPASNTVLGGVKVGTNVSVLGDGTISVPPVAAFQTPWLSNIAGANFSLTNVSQVAINTTTTSEPLTVAGGIRSTAAQVSNQANALTMDFGGGVGRLLITGSSTTTYNGFQFVQLHSDGTGQIQPMIILANGNVGIGTTNVLYRLDVRTPGATASQVHIASTDTDAGAYLTSFGDSNFQSSAGAQYNGTNWVAKGTAATTVQHANVGLIAFNVDTGLTVGNTYTPTARAYINTTGLGIGLNPTHQLQLSTDDAAKLTTNTWTIASGAKVKKHVRRLKGGLDVINKLSPTEAQYNGHGGTPDGQRVVSLIAEEVREILPHTVTEDSDGNLGFNIHEVIHHLILAVQQLSKKLEKVEAVA